MKKSTLFEYKVENTSNYVFSMLTMIAIAGCVFGLFIETPAKAIEGLYAIIMSSDALITDYVEVGGLGGAFLNAGLVMSIAILIQKILKLPFSGMSVACTTLMFGFALFGKNIVNILPILFGGWLYAKVQKEHLAKSIYAVLFGTCLAPVGMEFASMMDLPFWKTILVAITIGISIGFIIAPISAFTIRLHMGYNLYNTGFSAGMICFILTSIMRAAGYEFTSNSVWSTSYTLEIGLFLGVIFGIMLLGGLLWNGKRLRGYKRMLKRSGRAIADFIIMEGLPLTLINMGLLGFGAIAYILLIGAPINGPVAGGILSIVGFGAFGKHIRNVYPVVLGVVLASVVMNWDLTSPTLTLAALFVTALAPIAGHFGVFWGIVVGFIHAAVIHDVGTLHGWLNLYNNGFAAGFICVVMIPFIEMWNFADEDDEKANWFIVTPLKEKIITLITKNRKN